MRTGPKLKVQFRWLSAPFKCSGTGSPTVVIESGWGGSSATWGWVQPEVSRVTRVCTYDRAGMGWSEPSPYPRTARQFAKELHTLLEKANEPGPYVLVAHSLGGYTARVYAHDYPDEVSGFVLIDVQDLPSSDGALKPAPKPGRTSLPALLARVGLTRLLAGPLGAIQILPPAEKQAYRLKEPMIVDFELESGAPFDGKEVRDLGLPPGCVLVRIFEGGREFVPKATTRLEAYMKITAVIAPEANDSLAILRNGCKAIR